MQRKWLLEALLGLAMLPLTVVPIGLYLAKDDTGYLMYLRGRYKLFPPSTPALGGTALQAAQRAQEARVRGVAVLAYHGIGRGATDTADGRFVVSRARFAEQMQSLRYAGYQAISTGDLARYLRTNDEDALPRKPILITFDDGRADAMLQADPILEDTAMKATMFVIGARAGAGSFYYASWDDLADYVASGRWELGNHTYDLHDLHAESDAPLSALVDPEPGEPLAAYRKRVQADLERQQSLLTAHVGREAVTFAYPYGDWGGQAPPETAAALREVLEERFQLAFDQDGQSGWRPALPGDDPLHVHRLEVMDWSGPELLARLEAAARHSAAVYAERALGHRFSESQLLEAAARARCTPAGLSVIRDRHTQRGGKSIALTFDGGPSLYTPQVLDVLRLHDAVATFFVTGSEIEGREGLLRRMLAEGHEIGNGTLTGIDPLGAEPGTLAREIAETNRLVAEAVPFTPCLFRPPFGHAGRGTTRAAAALGLDTVLWSSDPRDYASQSPEEIAARVVDDAEPGAIVVLHDGGGPRWATVQALPRILVALSARGYRFVTVSQLTSGRAAEAA